MYVFPILAGFQANARTTAAEAMQEAMKNFGYKSFVYYSID